MLFSMITLNSIVTLTPDSTLYFQVIEDLGPDKCAIELITESHLKPSFVCSKKGLVFLFWGRLLEFI